MSLTKDIIKRTLRVPLPRLTDLGRGKRLAMQLDSTLLSAGFKLSGDLLKALSEMSAAEVKSLASDILDAVRELVGDHVKHNTYFKEFPKNVPDTHEFWLDCLIDALGQPGAATNVMVSLRSFGTINLLDLPKYGRYQHTYEEMLEAHEQFIPSIKDRVTILHLGDSLADEARDLYHSFAASAIPLNDADKELLATLAEVNLDEDLRIPVREHKAIINKVRIENGGVLLADTPTDILRLACYLSDGDVSLTEKTKFKSFGRPVRRALLIALNNVTGGSKLGDVNQYKEEWKRLGERLHPYDYKLPYAQRVFQVAHGDHKFRSLASLVEEAFLLGEPYNILQQLSKAPGMLFRSLDRVIRHEEYAKGITVKAVKEGAKKVSGRVILSVREHLYNRASAQKHSHRIFINKKGTSWVTEESRSPLNDEVVRYFSKILDDEIFQRLSTIDHLVIDPNIQSIALPLSDKNRASGFSVMPRGSTVPIHADIVRFFVYWKQKEFTTDYDLSALVLDENYVSFGHVSYTNLRYGGGAGRHSGDIVDAPAGASEFIDITLSNIGGTFVIPQVNIYNGEKFNQVEEAFFGFMNRDETQRGKPFEPRTVKMKGDLRGAGKVALPLIFMKTNNGWQAKWLNMFLAGAPRYNRVETNRLSTSLVTKAIVEKQYMPVLHITGLLAKKAKEWDWYQGQEFDHPVMYIGLEEPEDLPEGSKAITLSNLHELCPE